jgi:hypothetical protein
LELERLQAQSEKESQGSTDPSKLAEAVRKASRVAVLYQEMARELEQRRGVVASMEQELARYRKLKKLPPNTMPAFASEKVAQPGTLGISINCGNPDVCEQSWPRAREFFTERADTPTVWDSEDLLIAALPRSKSEISLVMSRNSAIETRAEHFFLDLRCRDLPGSTRPCDSPEADALASDFFNLVQDVREPPPGGAVRIERDPDEGKI